MKRHLETSDTKEGTTISAITLPIEIWSVVVEVMPLTPFKTLDLAMMLKLMSVSKTMFTVLVDRCLAYFSEVLDYHWVASYPAKDERFFDSKRRECRDAVMTMTVDFFDYSAKKLDEYVIACLCDTRYRTVFHFSNAISLLQYAYLQGIHLCKYTCIEPGYYRWKESITPGYILYADEATKMSELFYFDHGSKKAKQMMKCRSVSIFGKKERNTIYSDESLFDPPVVLGYEPLFIKLFLVLEEREKTLQPNEKTIKLRKPRDNDFFLYLVRESRGKRVPVWSDYSQDFRRHFFTMPKTTSLEDATTTYLLHHFYQRNQTIILDDQRYPFLPGLNHDCTSIHSAKIREYMLS